MLPSNQTASGAEDSSCIAQRPEVTPRSKSGEALPRICCQWHGATPDLQTTSWSRSGIVPGLTVQEPGGLPWQAVESDSLLFVDQKPGGGEVCFEDWLGTGAGSQTGLALALLQAAGLEAINQEGGGCMPGVFRANLLLAAFLAVSSDSFLDGVERCNSPKCGMGMDKEELGELAAAAAGNEPMSLCQTPGGAVGTADMRACILFGIRVWVKAASSAATSAAAIAAAAFAASAAAAATLAVASAACAAASAAACAAVARAAAALVPLVGAAAADMP